jgi:maleylpyruvate isomerase
MRPTAVIDECRSSHQRFVSGVARLHDDDLRASSELPRWSRRHVVAHVINKTRAHVWLFGGPASGEVRQLYPPGHDSDLAAEAAASRSASDLRDDVHDAFGLLETAWDALDDSLWDHESVMTLGRRRSMSEIVSHHLRDVEVHHVDLAIGYDTSDWPALFVEGELTRRLDGLPDRADHAELLAWLLGRRDAPELGPW